MNSLNAPSESSADSPTISSSRDKIDSFDPYDDDDYMVSSDKAATPRSDVDSNDDDDDPNKALDPTATIEEMLAALDVLKLDQTNLRVAAGDDEDEDDGDGDGGEDDDEGEEGDDDDVEANEDNEYNNEEDDYEDYFVNEDSGNQLEDIFKMAADVHDEKAATSKDGGEYYDSDEDVAGKRAQKKQKKAMMKNYILRRESNTPDPFSFVDDGAAVGGMSKGGSVEDRHRRMLLNMADRRKQQEDEAFKLLQKAQRKRKKFKDALLEKALRARSGAEEGDGIPAGGATQAFLLQKVKKTQTEELSEEEQLRRDEDKKAQVAAVRRKFKQQYKKVLDTLMLKNIMKEDQDGSKPKPLPGKKNVKKQPATVGKNGHPTTCSSPALYMYYFLFLSLLSLFDVCVSVVMTHLSSFISLSPPPQIHQRRRSRAPFILLAALSQQSVAKETTTMRTVKTSALRNPLEGLK